MPIERRMPKTNAALVLLLAASGLTAQSTQPAAGLADRLAAAGVFARIDAYVAQTMRQEGTPGLALGLTSRDRTLRVATYGFADRGARIPVTPEHLFEIGSISKSFTAIALL